VRQAEWTVTARRAGRTILCIVASALLGGCTPPSPGDPGSDGSSAPEPSGAELLLERSIRFHDPNGHWGKRPLRLDWNGSGADGEERLAFEISIAADGAGIELSGRYAESTLEYATDGVEVRVRVDGSSELDEETRKRLALGREDGLFWRNYFRFLAGLPMNLRDPGTRVDPDPVTTTFMDREVLSIRLSFDPDVGGDLWYFYFEPGNAELVGCRFYHDEAANDGEYIVMEGLVEHAGLRLPRHRRWHVNSDDRFLGADTLAHLAVAD